MSDVCGSSAIYEKANWGTVRSRIIRSGKMLRELGKITRSMRLLKHWSEDMIREKLNWMCGHGPSSVERLAERRSSVVRCPSGIRY